MTRTASFIEEVKTLNSASTEPKKRKPLHPNQARALREHAFPKGVSGNPGGKPKNDLAKQLAQEVYEENYAAIKAGISAQLRKGNGYVFSVTSDRAWGKLKEVKEITHLHENVPDPDLQQAIDGILADLGLARAVDEASGAAVAHSGTETQGSAAQDPNLLPR